MKAIHCFEQVNINKYIEHKYVFKLVVMLEQLCLRNINKRFEQKTKELLTLKKELKTILLHILCQIFEQLGLKKVETILLNIALKLNFFALIMIKTALLN